MSDYYDEVDFDLDLTWYETVMFFAIAAVAAILDGFILAGKCIRKLWK